MKGSVSLHLDSVQAREDLSSATAHLSKDPDVGDISAPRTSVSVERTTGENLTGFGDIQIGQRPKLGKFINSFGKQLFLFFQNFYFILYLFLRLE